MAERQTADPDDGDILPSDLSTTFLERSRTLKARAGQIIFSEGNEASDVYFVHSGRVRISILTSQGREIILRDIGAGEIFGELAAIDQGPRSAGATAIEDSVLAHMRGDDFVDLLGTVPQAGLWMTRRLAARVRDLTDKASDLVTLPVAGRVQGELLRLARDCGSVGATAVIKLVPTHADIAARIGTHREAVTRELNLLAKEGIIRQSGRSIELLAVARLQEHYERFRRS
ncbi:MAG: hypothetical protein JWQ16_2430 [Novosphingobium sp.]|nr:hypothetical protein [Novosphingobium sp.]